MAKLVVNVTLVTKDNYHYKILGYSFGMTDVSGDQHYECVYRVQKSSDGQLFQDVWDKTVCVKIGKVPTARDILGEWVLDTINTVMFLTKGMK